MSAPVDTGAKQIGNLSCRGAVQIETLSCRGTVQIQTRSSPNARLDNGFGSLYKYYDPNGKKKALHQPQSSYLKHKNVAYICE